MRCRGAVVECGDRVLVKIVAFDGKHKISDKWENDPYTSIFHLFSFKENLSTSYHTLIHQRRPCPSPIIYASTKKRHCPPPIIYTYASSRGDPAHLPSYMCDGTHICTCCTPEPCPQSLVYTYVVIVTCARWRSCRDITYKWRERLGLECCARPHVFSSE